MAQMAILLAEVDKVARLSDGSHCPIILCGDLNSVPDSPLYNFIRDGELQYDGMPAWKVKGADRCGWEQGLGRVSGVAPVLLLWQGLQLPQFWLPPAFLYPKPGS